MNNNNNNNDDDDDKKLGKIEKRRIKREESSVQSERCADEKKEKSHSIFKELARLFDDSMISAASLHPNRGDDDAKPSRLFCGAIYVPECCRSGSDWLQNKNKRKQKKTKFSARLSSSSSGCGQGGHGEAARRSIRKTKTESKHTHIKRKKNGQEQQKKTDRRDGRREPIRVAPLAAVPAGWQSHKWLLLRQKRSRASTFDPIIGQIPRNAITDRLAPIGWPSASRGRWWSREKRIAPSHWSTMTSFADRSESDQSEGVDVVGGRPARPRQSSAIQRSKMTSFVHGDQ